jgi:hypothetical protein
MKSKMTGHRWNALVCIDKNCVCDERVTEGGDIPDKCPYKILHLVETRRAGFHERPRRSGKTTELTELATQLAQSTGKPVYYVSPSLDMVTHVRACFVVDKKVRFLSLGQVMNGYLRGVPAGLVLMDELTPDEQRKIEPELVFS